MGFDVVADNCLVLSVELLSTMIASNVMPGAFCYKRASIARGRRLARLSVERITEMSDTSSGWRSFIELMGRSAAESPGTRNQNRPDALKHFRNFLLAGYLTAARAERQTRRVIVHFTLSDRRT